MKTPFISASAIALAASLTVFGAGCQKSATPATTPSATKAAPTKPAQPSQNPNVISFGTDNVANTKINQELNQILTNFRNAKSFRTKFSIPSGQGTVETMMEFIRPNRFRAVMNVKNVSSELIAVDSSIYMRANGTKWMDLSGSEMSKPMTDTLKNAMGGDNSIDKLIVDPNTVVKKEQDTARNCTQYSAVVHSPTGTPVSLNICAVNMLPKYVDVTSSTGKITFDYYDFDTLFLIEKPM